MDYKYDEGIFLVYSISNRVFRVYNKRTKIIIESINVIVHDFKDLVEKKIDDD